MEPRQLRRLKTKLLDLKLARDNFHRNNPSKSTGHLDYQIVKLEADIRRFENNLYQKKTTLGELLPKDDSIRNIIYKKVIAISLAADFLIDTAEIFKSELNKYDVETTDINNEVRALVDQAQKTACRLLGFNKGALDDLLLDNGSLLEDLYNSTMLYIDNTLKPKNK